MPLLDLRVWRFRLAYYFVFGAFVALALWLPKYYVGEYGLPLATAAFLTILFDLPSGAIRALGGWASDKVGGNQVTWWVLWISLASLVILSYPPTTMVIHGIKGDVAFSIEVGIVLFTILIFILGLAQGFELVHHLALQALEVLQRHVQKVAAAAGRIEHAGGAELVVTTADLGAGFFELGLALLAKKDITFFSNFTPKLNTYYAIYFTLTGLHGLHVIAGALVLTYFLLIDGRRLRENPEHMATRVEVGGLFWHYVDLVWIFLFPLLYLL